MILITATFAKANNGKQTGINVFSSAKCDGPTSQYFNKFVCSDNSLTEFPELFEGKNIVYVDVTEKDFIKINTPK